MEVCPSVSSSRKQDRGKDLKGMEAASKLPRKLECHSKGGHNNNQIASKNDDAPVDTADWDIWTVNNFTPPEVAYSRGKSTSKVMFKEAIRSQVLVCKPGKYHPDKHGRLFDSL